jgi:membrane protein YdbS with pleckstrin-like domain
MSYIAHSLAASETLIYRARFPWFYSVGAWAILIASVVAAVAVEWEGYGWTAALPLVVGAGLWLAIMVPIWATEIGVTSQRLIYKKGLLWRKTQELQLRAIEEVNLDQGVMGRLLDFGNLELRGTGVDDIALPTLADPLGLRKALQDGMAAATQTAGVAAPIVPRPEVSHTTA